MTPILGAATVSYTSAIVAADIAVIIAIARVMGALFRRIGQPTVVGEIIGGIALGPSLLGAFPGHLTTRVFTADAVPHLKVLADLGVVLFMFIVGLEVDLGRIKGRVGAAVSVSLSSIALPFGFGILLAVTLLHHPYGLVGRHTVHVLPFALFIGASMSITAFPVLARILTERRMLNTQLGTMALASAAVDDVMAWSLLALVIGVVESTGSFGLPETVAETIGLVLVLVFVVRPGLNWVMNRARGVDEFPLDLLALILIGLLATAAIADAIGVDLIFGGFVFGATLPKRGNEALVATVVQRIESLAVVLLLPIFFMVTGLSVNIRTIGWHGLGYLVAILAVAVGGKFVGATVAARANGMTSRQSAGLGTLMNTRGLTELVILNVGLQLGVLSEKLFTLMVVMAVVTTVMTDPLLRLVYPDRMIKADLADEERKLSGEGAPGYRAMVVVEGAPNPPMMELAGDVVGRSGTIFLATYLSTSAETRLSSTVSVDLQRVATAMESLQLGSTRRPGTEVRHIVRVSADPAADIIEQVSRAGIDVVLVAAASPVAQRLLADAPAHLMLWAPGEQPLSSTVTVVAQENVDDDTAVELAVRAVMGRGTASDLRLVPGHPKEAGRLRRLGERASEISAVDGSVELADDVTSGTLLLVGVASSLGARTSLPGAVVVVRSADDPQRVNLDQRFERLSAQALLAARPLRPEPPSTERVRP